MMTRMTGRTTLDDLNLQLCSFCGLPPLAVRFMALETVMLSERKFPIAITKPIRAPRSTALVKVPGQRIDRQHSGNAERHGHSQAACLLQYITMLLQGGLPF